MSRFLEFTLNSSQLLLWEIFSISVYCDSFVSFVGSDTTISFSSPNFARRCQRKVSVNRPYAFRKFGIVIQLIVSLVFIFCTVVIMKQIYFLKHTDLGMDRHNIANVALWRGDIKQWGEKIAVFTYGDRSSASPLFFRLFLPDQ